MNRRPTKVKCWCCGAEDTRHVYTMPRTVVTGTRRRCYGRCVDKDKPPFFCQGTMHTPKVCRIIVSAALLHEHRGGNRRSEYD